MVLRIIVTKKIKPVILIEIMPIKFKDPECFARAVCIKKKNGISECHGFYNQY